MGPVDARLLDEAAHWLARSHSSSFSAAEQQELARWRSRSPAHEQVWLCAEQLQERLGSLPPALGMAVLNRPRRRSKRRQALRHAALLLATPALGWLGWRHLPWQSWSADYRTARGESRSITLADSSRVLLNTDSAISVRFDTQARRVRQHAGEILVETAHTPAYAARAFVVETEEGRMQALGTRFIVRRQQGRTRLAVLEGAVRVTPARSGSSVIVQAGQQLAFDARTAATPSPLAAAPDAWTHGMLYAERMRLQDFLAEVGRYREGLLLCDPQVAELRVSGAFQLRDTDRILELLAQTLPVNVRSRTRYWVTVTEE